MTLRQAFAEALKCYLNIFRVSRIRKRQYCAESIWYLHRHYQYSMLPFTLGSTPADRSTTLMEGVNEDSSCVTPVSGRTGESCLFENSVGGPGFQPFYRIELIELENKRNKRRRYISDISKSYSSSAVQSKEEVFYDVRIWLCWAMS